MERVEVTAEEWAWTVDRLASLEAFTAAVGDLLWHHTERTGLGPTVEPGPRMTYDIGFLLDGGYQDLDIATAVHKDIWNVRYERVLALLKEVDDCDRHS